jgi:tungstate transport system ATP-binding protein
MAPPLYDIRNLTQVYRGRPVLEIEALALPRGGIIGIIGPNGSGKSTLLRLAGFIEHPTAGEIRFDGRPAAPFAAEVRHRVALLPQEPYLMKRTVLQNVAYGLKLRRVAGAGVRARVDAALAGVGLDAADFARRPAEALSGGEAQRVALAARLALRPEVLLLDEPTASVDALSAQLIQDAVLQARREWGMTLIVASHDWPWLTAICDTVRHLLKGRLVGSGGGNILFGPWAPAENGCWGRRLADGQRLLVPRPPSPDAAAVIDGAAIVGAEARGAAGEVTLTGTITRLALEKASGGIVASLLVANQPFTAALSAAEARQRGLFPGRTAAVRYALGAVRWV